MASSSRSKRKSSPSRKKKRRTNKDLSKKRSKLSRGKSREVSSESESLSVASSMSYSSSESDRGRLRSRSRKDTSKRRKKSRLRSESSEDAGLERRKKKTKKSKDRDSKKKRVKRKRRREPSVSCSTCESSDDSEVEYKRSKKKKARRIKGLDEDRSTQSDRPSESSCRLELDGGDGSLQTEERRPEEINPRRLRSIIIFAKECEDKEVLDRDGHKEEIIYDHDDYPSPKSNESNDGDHKSAVRAGRLEDQHGETVASKVSITELPERSNLGVNSVSSTDAGSNNNDLEAVLRQKALENFRKLKGGLRAEAKKPVSTKSSNRGEAKQSSSLKDVECQKKDQMGSAGGVDASLVPRKSISTVGQLSSGTIKKSSSFKSPLAESLQTLPQESIMASSAEEGKPDNVDRLKGGEVGVLSLKEKHRGVIKPDDVDRLKGGEVGVLSLKEKHRGVIKPDDVDRLKGGEVGVLSLKEKHRGVIKLAKQAAPTQQLPVLNIPVTESLALPSKVANAPTDYANAVHDSNKKGGLPLRQRFGPNKLYPNKLYRQLTSIPESSEPISEPALNKDTIETVQSTHDAKIVSEVDKTTTELSSSDAPNLDQRGSNDKEIKEGDSQFQQKTMSVMRGGESVQVNYKVYIPKNARALGRKLKR